MYYKKFKLCNDVPNISLIIKIQLKAVLSVSRGRVTAVAVMAPKPWLNVFPAQYTFWKKCEVFYPQDLWSELWLWVVGALIIQSSLIKNRTLKSRGNNMKSFRLRINQITKNCLINLAWALKLTNPRPTRALYSSVRVFINHKNSESG